MDFADVPLALLAGGLATRLQPVTERIPKALVEVAGRPFIEHQLELFARHGIRRAVLCVGHLGNQIAARLGPSACGIQLSYSYDGPTLLGTGGALRRAASLLGDVCWVVYGDSYMDIDYRGIWAAFERARAPALMVVLNNNGRWDRSNVVFRDGQLLKYDKRVTDPEMTYIDYGVALLRREIVERIPEHQSFDLADLYRRLVEERLMVGYEVTERFYEIGSPEGLAEAERVFSSRSGDGP